MVLLVQSENDVLPKKDLDGYGADVSVLYSIAAVSRLGEAKRGQGAWRHLPTRPAEEQLELLTSIRQMAAVFRSSATPASAPTEDFSEVVASLHRVAETVVASTPALEIEAAQDAESVFELLGRRRDENLHSDCIAALLDPSKVGPAAKEVFCRLLFEGRRRTVVAPDEVQYLAVYRELRLDSFSRRFDASSGRMDIFARANAGLLVIENKIDAPEARSQTSHYASAIESYYEGDPRPRSFLMLSPGGGTASSPGFRTVTYRRLFSLLHSLRSSPGWTRRGERLLRIYLDELAKGFFSSQVRATERSANYIKKANHAR